MRRTLALVQLLGFLVALGAMLAPSPRLVAEHWSSQTIYPWWTLAFLGLGGAAAVVSLLAPRGSARLLAASAAVSGVYAAQVGGLGVWAQKHWRPAFGFGGGYAGEQEDLKALAWVVAIAGTFAALAAVGQLMVQRDWPTAVPRSARLSRVVVGLTVLVGVPFLLAAADRFLRDRNSLVALALVYAAPWGLSIAGSGWLTKAGTKGVLGACCLSAALSAFAPSGQLTLHEGRPVFAVLAALFAALLAIEALPQGSNSDQP